MFVHITPSIPFLMAFVYSLTESLTATFGPTQGLITYYFPPDALPSRSSDRLAFGFRASPNLRGQVTLLRVENQNGVDFLEVEIVSLFTLRFKL